jgi:hypothetical protein
VPNVRDQIIRAIRIALPVAIFLAVGLVEEAGLRWK